MVKRFIGAHYGLREWLIQRVTALVMLLYTFCLIAFIVYASQGGYLHWQQLFTYSWVKVLTSITIIAVVLHAWVGMRDIWMDYIKGVKLRFTLYILTILWLGGCLIYSIKVVWGG